MTSNNIKINSFPNSCVNIKQLEQKIGGLFHSNLLGGIYCKENYEFTQRLEEYFGSRVMLTNSGTNSFLMAVEYAIMKADGKKIKWLVSEYLYFSISSFINSRPEEVIIMPTDSSEVQINFENEIDHDFFYIIIITDHNGLSADLPASLRELPYKFIIRDSCLVFRPNKTRVDVDFCSFSNNKFLVGGEGGCLISRDENLMEFVKYRSFSNIQPTIPTPEFMYTGKYSYIKSSSPFKGSISGIVSCVLHEQLQQIAVINEIRQKNHEYLSRYLPCLIDSVVDNPLFFTLKLPDNYSKRRIFALQMHCLASGLQTMIGVLPHKFYLDSKFYKKHVLSLPIHTELSKDDLESIVTIVSQNL